ncbi:helicase [Methylomonas sp. ZR1]|uniref:helicase n=1 Tax=Methylomonas sp. ZR1 TaxID=1797072 RepID=UPI001493186A|nr:helicase [Methylomonas sp. ZR1]
MLDPIQRHSLWGQTFEIAVKRGVLTALMASAVQELDSFDLTPWKTLGAADVYVALANELREVDQNLKARTRETARHLFELGMGLGQTAMREYLRKLKPDAEDYRIKALWCPLQLPRLQGDFDAEREEALLAWAAAFGQERIESALANKGFPARADFLLWLEPRYDSLDREFLCLEFSLNGLPETADYSKPDAHLEELRRFAWFMDTRSVFSRVCAEVSGEEFLLSPDIKNHLPAFTGRDKPLYKLCQAASYIHTSMRWLKSQGLDDKPCNTRALSITQNGFESLAARFFSRPEVDPRVSLLESLGRAYRDAEKVPDCDEEALNDHIRYAFDKIRKALPNAISKQFVDMCARPEPGKSQAFNFSEDVEGFLNPMATMPWQEALSWVDSDSIIADFFKANPQTAISETLAERVKYGQSVPLRDLHSAAVVAGMRSSAPGQMTLLGLEGNPGIGKTTAVVSFLKESSEGFLFLYVSPRVIINDDVTENLARDRTNNQPSGILTVTTNSKLIGAAKAWYEKQVLDGTVPKRMVDSAVVADGVENLKHPDNSTLILSPSTKEELELTHIGSSNRKRAETERQDRMEDDKRPGVLKVLSLATRNLLAENTDINRVVLTAAIQGYRELGGDKSTLSALDYLFKNPTNKQAGKLERREFAQRIQTIVVMVDELTGDGAGAPFIHTVARWLDQQFIRPFDKEPLFRVILIVSDASLGNEIVLDRYLNSGKRTPDKVLVSKSAGKRPFRLSAMPVRIGGKRVPVLHIMTNSYPATKLAIDYRVRLDLIKPGELSDGRIQTVRQAIAEQQGEAIIGNVIQEIRRALDSGADQVIFFAQDKAFLRLVQTLLVTSEDGEPLLYASQVAILDSSVTAAKRKALIADDKRDTVKVFLMTSSGARGVSFPKTDWIIAMIPRFGIEAALMEVAQLIYRGRGKYYTSDDGVLCDDGDWKDRRLVMLLQDFLPQDEVPEPRQWLRQVSDLLTYLVMLRSTIYTRIVGDAGLDRQNLAMVPVGGIGSEEMLSLMSTHVRAFLREAEVFLRDFSADVNRRGLVSNAQKNTQHLFSKFSLDATARSKDFKSVVRLEDIQTFSRRASADNAPLLISPNDDPDCLLPDHLYCIGPFWLEHWEILEKQERFNVEGWSTDVGHQSEKLFGELSHIYKDETLPFKLRHSAEELFRILVRKKDEATREFSTVKSLQSPSTWVVVPLDYPRFWKKDASGRLPSLGDDEIAWRDSLGACIPTTAEILPVIPRYADIPYAAVIGEQDPARLELIFDDRYLAASNELNLLNTILLAE